MAEVVWPPDGKGAGTVNGRTPGSLNEWWVAVALDQFGWDFGYQVPFYFGGTKTVADFVVNTLPLNTPLFVDGEYWHQNGKDDAVRAMLDAELRGKYAPHRVITGEKSIDLVTARQSVAHLFGRA